MVLRMAILLLVFTQCSSSKSNLVKLSVNDKASYQIYNPGAGGGQGVNFEINLSDSVANLQPIMLIVNGDTLKNLELLKNQQTVVASLFYPDPEPTVDNPNPKPIAKPLIGSAAYQGTLVYKVLEKEYTLEIKDFIEKESPLFP